MAGGGAKGLGGRAKGNLSQIREGGILACTSIEKLEPVTKVKDARSGSDQGQSDQR